MLVCAARSVILVMVLAAAEMLQSMCCGGCVAMQQLASIWQAAASYRRRPLELLLSAQNGSTR